MGAYVDGKPFSVELVAAVGPFVTASFRQKLTNHQAMRQATFTDKIHQLGWLDPAFFNSPESAQVVQHCVLRYYGLVVFPTLLLRQSHL